MLYFFSFSVKLYRHPNIYYRAYYYPKMLFLIPIEDSIQSIFVLNYNLLGQLGFGSISPVVAQQIHTLPYLYTDYVEGYIHTIIIFVKADYIIPLNTVNHISFHFKFLNNTMYFILYSFMSDTFPL